MYLRLLFTSRLATAVTTQLPELKIAFQFFLPIPAVLKNPMRSFFIKSFDRSRERQFAHYKFFKFEPTHVGCYMLRARVPESRRPAAVRCRRTVNTKKVFHVFPSGCATSAGRGGGGRPLSRA